MKTHRSIFMQCVLCLLLFAFFLTLNYRKANYAAQAGTFGFSEKANDTLEQLAQNLYTEVCNEQ